MIRKSNSAKNLGCEKNADFFMLQQDTRDETGRYEAKKDTYIRKLERENARLRQLLAAAYAIEENASYEQCRKLETSLGVMNQICPFLSKRERIELQQASKFMYTVAMSRSDPKIVFKQPGPGLFTNRIRGSLS